MVEAAVTEVNTFEDVSRLQSVLFRALPNSIALHGRLELLLPRIQIRSKSNPPTLRAFDNSVIFTTSNSNETLFRPEHNLPDRFAFLFFHPTCPDGLAATLYTSLERDASAGLDPEHSAVVTDQLHAILRRVTRDPLATHLATGYYGPSRLKLSTVASASHRALLALGIVVNDPPIYQKLLIARDETQHLRRAAPLPEGLAFDAVRQPDYAGVMATNELVRSEAALDAMQGLGVRENTTGRLVAWGFWAIHGSLRTVFVVPEWRGRGLARTLMVRMIDAEPGGAMAVDAQVFRSRAYLSTDVAPENTASQSLMRGLGARSGWDVVWPEIDLSLLAE